MIRLPPPDPDRPEDAYALSLLADLAGALPVLDQTAPVVSVSVADRADGGLTGLRADDYGITHADGVVSLARSLLDALVSVAGAAAEQGVTESDRYGRVPSAANPMVAAGLEREPVLSQAAARFTDAVRRAAGRRPVAQVAPWPNGHRWAAAITHDLDVVDHWPAFTLLRLVELARRGRLARAARVAGSALRAIGRDPVWRAIDAVLALERRHDLRSTWFVLCGNPTVATMRAGDLTYRPDGTRARRILQSARDAGHEIGLHGSFATWTHVERFEEQRARLARLAAHPVTGVRQHYIRMRPGTTQQAMAEAGFAYDASYGFPDRNGFRLGVADVVPGWDAQRRAPSGLDEIPLIWMDRALSKYRGVEDPAVWVADALELAERCRRVGGLWVGLWHPNLAPPLGFPGAPPAFAAVLDGIVQDEPWIAPLREVVAWRRVRRAARARGVRPDGRVDLHAAPEVSLWDAEGRSLTAARS